MADAFTGARAVLALTDNQTHITAPVGFAAGVGLEEAIDYDPISVIGMLEYKEFAPVAYRCGMTAQSFRIVGSPLKDFGDQHMAVFPKEKDILTSGNLTAFITDQLTGRVICSVQEVKAASHTWDITARGVVAEQISFVCIRVQDESEV